MKTLKTSTSRRNFTSATAAITVGTTALSSLPQFSQANHFTTTKGINIVGPMERYSPANYLDIITEVRQKI